MVPVLSREQVRALDRHASEVCSVPSLLLMENAGRGAADAIAARTDRRARVLVLCGGGNNGGDGFVVARRLRVLDRDVRVLLLGTVQALSGDARVNADAWRGVGGILQEVGELAPVAQALDQSDIVVDALFGTGLSRPIEGLAREVIDAVNARGRRVFALDVPSGLDADSGQILGVAARAEVTLTFAHLKWGLLGASSTTGEVQVVDIGVPALLHRAVGQVAEIAEESDVRQLLARRPRPAHKGVAGRVLIVAGGPGTLGAARLSAHGAHRTAAGLVKVATFAPAARALDQGTWETMTAELEGAGRETLEPLLDWADAIVAGPGFGVGEASQHVTREILARASVPVVLDADGLTHFAGRPEALSVNRRLLLTPHPGEAARLLGVCTDAVEADRLGAARELAGRSGATVLLKGERTLIVGPDPADPAVVNTSGTHALAVGGSGDVLSGMLGALCCHLEPRQAAVAGAWVHGRAGQRVSGPSGRTGLLAREVADAVPDVIAALEQGDAPL